MASVPAAKYTSSLFAKVVEALVPAASVAQLLVPVSHVPVGVAPAPAVVVLRSQYLAAAKTELLTIKQLPKQASMEKLILKILIQT